MGGRVVSCFKHFIYATVSFSETLQSIVVFVSHLVWYFLRIALLEAINFKWRLPNNPMYSRFTGQDEHHYFLILSGRKDYYCTLLADNTSDKFMNRHIREPGKIYPLEWKAYSIFHSTFSAFEIFDKQLHRSAAEFFEYHTLRWQRVSYHI